jgi:hypothetical protein
VESAKQANEPKRSMIWLPLSRTWQLLKISSFDSIRVRRTLTQRD